MSIEDLLETMRKENAAAHAETRAYVDVRLAATDAKVDAGLGSVNARLDAGLGSVKARLDHLDATVESIDQSIKAKVDPLPGKIDLLAEGLLNLDEKLDRETADIRSEMRRGFAETQAMLKFALAKKR